MSYLNSELGARMIKDYKNIVREYYKTPEILYHYTNVNGLIGIIESKKIWATDSRFLNDFSEISYGVELVKDILDDAIKKEESGIILKFLKECKSFDTNIKGLFEIYITCFCEDGNLLSQWRGYGDRGDGYSIGIEIEKIKRFEYQIGVVIYSKEEQKFIMNSIIQYYSNILKEMLRQIGEEHAEGLITTFVQYCSFFLLKTICMFKHPSFEEEKEWRLVELKVNYRNELLEGMDVYYLDKIKFRSGNEYLIPYLEIDLATEKSNNTIPIKKVIYGPSKQSELKKIALEQFMKKNNYLDIKIIDSDIPFRG